MTIKIQVDTAIEVFANVVPLMSNNDFITIDEAVAYDEAGMDLNWNFITTAGVVTQTNVTPTTGGNYDWSHVGNGMYKIEIPASGGASINNDREGVGWFSGVCTGVLAWVSPQYEFSPANIVNSLVNGTDYLEVDAVAISGDSTAANNAESFFDGTGYAGTNNVIPLVTTTTTATNLTTNNDKAGYSISGTLTTLDAIWAKILKTLQLLVRKDAAIATDNATELTALNANGGSGAGAYSNQTDALEAVRDHVGDGTNLTEAGGTGDHLTAINLPDQTMNITGNLSGSVGSVTGGSTFNPATDTVVNVTTVATVTNDVGITQAGADKVWSSATRTLSAISSTLRNQIADSILRRSTANVEASAEGDAVSFRSLLGAVSKLAHKVSITGTTLTVTKSDDATALGTQTLTTDASADPVTGADTN